MANKQNAFGKWLVSEEERKDTTRATGLLGPSGPLAGRRGEGFHIQVLKSLEI